MRSASENFIIANDSGNREPRVVVKILNDHYTIYLTSHDDVTVPAGEVFSGVIIEAAGRSQDVTPERGWSSIGSSKITFLDIGFTALLKNLKDTFNDSLVNNKVELYSGFKDLDFADYLLHSTLNVTSVSNNENRYTLTVQDIQRFVKRSIFRDLASTNCASSLGEDRTGLLEVVSTEGFTTVKHDSNWFNGSDNGIYGYFTVTGNDGDGRSVTEVVRWSLNGSDDQNFNVIERGCFGTRSVDIQGSQDGGTSEVTDHVYLDLPLPVMVIALLTGDLYGQQGVFLPETYHAGVDPSLLDIESFESIGEDLWGFRLQFRGVEDEGAKTFIAEQCLAPFNLQPIVDQFGRYKLRRFSTSPMTTSGVKILNYDNLTEISGLERDAKSVRNIFAINWGWDVTQGYYPLRSTYADGASRALNNFWSDVYEINLRGIYNTSRSNQYIVSRLAEGIRARFSAPRVTPRVTGFMSDLFDLEIGDVVSLNLYNHPDYASSTGSTLASFEVQGITYDFFAGTVGLKLYGSSGIAEPLDLKDGKDVATIPTAGWTNLNSLPNTSANGDELTITGDITLDDDKYVWAGNVVVNSNVTITLKGSVFLRFRDWEMLSGARIDGKGGGVVGAQGIYGGQDLRSEGLFTARAGFLNLDRYYRRSNDTSRVPSSNAGGLPNTSSAYIDENGTIVNFDFTQKLYGNGGGQGGTLKVRESSDSGDYVGGSAVAGGAGLVMFGENFFATDDGCIDVSGSDNDDTYSSISIAGTRYEAGAGGSGWPGTVQFYQTNRLATPPSLRNKVVANVGAFNERSTYDRRAVKSWERRYKTPSGDVIGPYRDNDASYASTDQRDAVVRLFRIASLAENKGTAGKDPVQNAQAPIITITPQYNTERTGYADEITLQLEASPQPSDNFFKYVLFEWRLEGQAQWIPIAYDLSTSSNVKVRADGRTVEIKATAYNTAGYRGGVTVEQYVTPVIDGDSSNLPDDAPSEITLPKIRGFELVNRITDEDFDKFKSPNAEFRWFKMSNTFAGSVAQLNGAVDLHLEGYKVRVSKPDGAILREELVKDSAYTYTYDKNKKDNGGSPVRQFIVEVQPVATTGYAGEFVGFEVENPAPAAPANVTSLAGFTSILLTSALPDDVDFVGVDWYLLEGESGDVYTDGSVQRVNSNTFNPDGLKTGTVYQIGAVSVDQFGTGGQVAQFAVQTVNVVADTLGDITEPVTIDESGGRLITNNNGYIGVFGVTNLPDVTNPVVLAAYDGISENTVFYVDVSGNGQFGKLGLNADGSITSDQFNIDASGNATFSGDLNAAGGTFSGDLNAADGTFSGKLTASAIDAVDTINLKSGAVYAFATNNFNETSPITTTSTGYTNTDVALSLSLQSGWKLALKFRANVNNNTSGRSVDARISISGATSYNGFETRFTSSTANTTGGLITFENFDVTATGTYTIRVQFKVTAGTGTMRTRQLHADVYKR